MSPPSLVKCRICGEVIDLADGDAVSDDAGHWAHEACQDAEDEADQNAADLDPVDYECYSDADPGL